MTSYNLQELIEIGKHLAKINEIQDQNEDSDEIQLDIPERIVLTSVTHGLPLGDIVWSGDTEQYVFVPHEEKPEEAPKWASSIPLPPTRFP